MDERTENYRTWSNRDKLIISSTRMPQESTYDINQFIQHGIEGIAGPPGTSQFTRFSWIREQTGRHPIVSFGSSYGFDIAWARANKNIDGTWETDGEGCAGIELDERCKEGFELLIPGAQFLNQDVLQKTPFKDKEFEIAICAEILEHVRPQEIHIILEEAWRISNKIVITVPDASGNNYNGGAVEAIEHFTLFTPDTFGALLQPGDRLANWYRDAGYRHRFIYAIEQFSEFIGVVITGATPI